MTLYLIGLGLSTEKDITIKGLETIQKCDLVYLENYTSLLQCTLEDLKKLYGKKLILANREITEQGEDKIIEEAKSKEVAFLVIGDPFSATTHVELFKSAREKNVKVKIINNASVLTSIGITGLQLYKFGRTASIPFLEEIPQLEAPYNLYRENTYLGMHTLFLLDLRPDLNKFMTINRALEILENIEKRKGEKLIKDDLLVVGCARLGSDDFLVKSGPLKEIKMFDFGKPPHCLIIPGKMHFMEEDLLRLWE
ncbi:diphthine synthase [Candidatus Woesearchaeota archaeon CG_4_10_14_0_2_um_filter_33_13]|nr:MAG: diphthine synthase [Candidatus Woesearchaeota archaeon CG_4_10_14_0_2_um_filter_33_13]